MARGSGVLQGVDPARSVSADRGTARVRGCAPRLTTEVERWCAEAVSCQTLGSGLDTGRGFCVSARAVSESGPLGRVGSGLDQFDAGFVYDSESNHELTQESVIFL